MKSFILIALFITSYSVFAKRKCIYKYNVNNGKAHSASYKCTNSLRSIKLKLPSKSPIINKANHLSDIQRLNAGLRIDKCTQKTIGNLNQTSCILSK
jgi:hypothetical protein